MRAQPKRHCRTSPKAPWPMRLSMRYLPCGHWCGSDSIPLSLTIYHRLRRGIRLPFARRYCHSKAVSQVAAVIYLQSVSVPRYAARKISLSLAPPPPPPAAPLFSSPVLIHQLHNKQASQPTTGQHIRPQAKIREPEKRFSRCRTNTVCTVAIYMETWSASCAGDESKPCISARASTESRAPSTVGYLPSTPRVPDTDLADWCVCLWSNIRYPVPYPIIP